MCYRAGAFIEPEAAVDRAQLRLLGWLGEDSDEVLAAIDPIEDDKPGTAVMVRQHPAVLIANDPELWRVVDDWDTGVQRKPRRGDSNWRTAALLTMRSAHARERNRDFMRRARERAAKGE